MTLLILNKLAQDMEWPENYLTVFYLITIHTPISAQWSDCILQITASVALLFVYFIKAYADLNCIDFYPQHMLL